MFIRFILTFVFVLLLFLYLGGCFAVDNLDVKYYRFHYFYAFVCIVVYLAFGACWSFFSGSPWIVLG